MGPQGAARFNLIGNVQPVREDSTPSEGVESSRSGATPHRQQACTRVSSLTLHMPASTRPRPGSNAPDPSHYTRSVALHPIRRATPDPSHYTRSVALHPIRRTTPDQKRCNAYGSGVSPPETSPTAGIYSQHTQAAASDAARQPRNTRPAPNKRRCTRYVAIHPLRRDTPDQKGCNAYGSGAPLHR